ncbi:hypothetical protein C2G38_2173559 [Gigaspora rosea]|uniref:Kelch repeat protein n=1 Tax=Gigaspora rosea TaxID=44941 RepID=A0A397VMS2_9GLOM|nr:hypothetical protein C2G38_2173559 [Gigaspora rosea]
MSRKWFRESENQRYISYKVAINLNGGNKESNNFYSATTITNEFFYLDVSKPFKTDDDSIPWVDLTDTGGPLKTEASACIGGKNNSMIFIFGGFSHSSGDLYANQSFGITNNNTNDLWVFNTLTWSSNARLPIAKYGYCVVTLPDGNILYIGGYFNFKINSTNLEASMNDSISDPNPSPRYHFSAVLISDGRFIIFGGHSVGTISDPSSGINLGDLWFLNTHVLFQWSPGNISNPILDLALNGHTTTLVDNYMLKTMMAPNAE